MPTVDLFRVSEKEGLKIISVTIALLNETVFLETSSLTYRNRPPLSTPLEAPLSSIIMREELQPVLALRVVAYPN
jgi:hypothetical protein